MMVGDVCRRDSKSKVGGGSREVLNGGNNCTLRRCKASAFSLQGLPYPALRLTQAAVGGFWLWDVTDDFLDEVFEFGRELVAVVLR